MQRFQDIVINTYRSICRTTSVWI